MSRLQNNARKHDPFELAHQRSLGVSEDSIAVSLDVLEESGRTQYEAWLTEELGRPYVYLDLQAELVRVSNRVMETTNRKPATLVMSPANFSRLGFELSSTTAAGPHFGFTTLEYSTPAGCVHILANQTCPEDRVLSITSLGFPESADE